MSENDLYCPVPVSILEFQGYVIVDHTHAGESPGVFQLISSP
jgi:hypothetical protein